MTHHLYCDESCHLEHDGLPVMCIGYIKINESDYPTLKEQIKEIKQRFKSPTELKWNKVSLSRVGLYKALVDFFFDNSMEFRCILVKYKHKLNHADFNQGSHDNFYYKLVYFLLNSATNPITHKYRIFLDIKDTRGRERLKKTAAVFENKHKGKSPFIYFQHIHSSENELLPTNGFIHWRYNIQNQGRTSEAKCIKSKG